MAGNWYVMQSKPNREEALYSELVARDKKSFSRAFASTRLTLAHAKLRPISPDICL